MKFMGAGAGAAIAPLVALHSRAAHAAPSFGPGFGPLAPALPLNTSELVVPGTGAPDLRNIPLLSLPRDFRYWALSWTGQPMSDGTLVPGDHDGMAAFRAPDGGTILVRNHELSNRESKFGNAAGVEVDPALKYDSFANGGTTTVRIDARGQLVSHFASLGGTNNNCAGGPTPWGTWLTCEESTSLPAVNGYTRPHGYVFEVPANATGPTQAVPLVAMGRFNREATATDPRTGIVYQTEDTSDSLFYRFVPNTPGVLLAGGRLEALKLVEYPQVLTAKGFLEWKNRPLAVEWVAIDSPNPAGNTFAESTRGQGWARGAARFARGEGAWYGNGLVYFCCTSGGNLGAGQVWAYDPAASTLTLVVESEDRAVLEAPDNITLGPDGRLYMFEDGSGGDNIVGVNRSGELFLVAQNIFNSSEFCGGCFSHDGRFMFVNMQSPGLTLVIEGPWRKGQR